MRDLDLLAWANHMVRTARFVEGGRTPAEVDCWGIIVLAYQRFKGIELPWYGGAEAHADKGVLAELFEQGRAHWLEVRSPDAWDVVLLRLKGRPIHVGLLVSPRTMVHAVERDGVLIEDHDGPTWKHRRLGFYRHPLLA